MWFADVVDTCTTGANGQALGRDDAAKLIEFAYAARYDAESALEQADKALCELLGQYHLAEQASELAALGAS